MQTQFVDLCKSADFIQFYGLVGLASKFGDLSLLSGFALKRIILIQ